MSTPSRRSAFAVATAALGLALAAASVPSPLYATYAAAWQFGPAMVTVVFAVYAVALLACLLVFGSLSDGIGRRRVIVAGLGLLGLSMTGFIIATGPAWLIVTRVVQGCATALITVGVAPALIDLQPPDRPARGAIVNAVTPTVGLPLGAVLAGALVEYAPAPLQLVFLLVLGGCLALAAAVVAMPEPLSVRRPVSLTPRISIPVEVRGVFARVAPSLVAAWGLGGLYLSLGPTLMGRLTGASNHFVGGLIVFALCAPGAVASLVAARRRPTTTLLAGCWCLIGGLLVTIAAVATTQPAVLVVGTVVAGAGFGMGFLGAMRMVLAVTPVEHRGGVTSAVYVVGYLAFSLPAVVAGVVAGAAGLERTATGYAAIMVVLALTAVIGNRRRSEQLAPLRTQSR